MLSWTSLAVNPLKPQSKPPHFQISSCTFVSEPEGGEETSIPFLTLYKSDAPSEKTTFLPNTAMVARVIEVERSSGINHPFNPNL